MGTIRELTKKDGSKSFHAEVRLKGHPPQRGSFSTRTKAKQWIQDVESGIRDGRHFRTVEAKRHTVGEMIDRFINQWLPKFPQRCEKQTALLTWWKKQCGHLLLSDLTSAVIAECRDQLLSESTIRGNLRSPSTVNRYLSSLGKALIVAMKEWNWIEDNPMRKISKPSEGKGRERYLSLEEKERLLQECQASRNPNLFPMVALALITGMRFGELASLRWEDVDFDKLIITLWQTKNGDVRYVPLTQEAKKILYGCHTFQSSPNRGLIFQSERNQLGVQLISIRGAFESALQRANIKNFRFHDLRHTAASYMAMAGATQGELMAILGHRSPQMTRCYAHYSQDHLHKVLERTKQTFNINKGE